MSGLIPQPFIDELIERTDLVELVDSYVPLKKRGTSYLACCPFHNEKTPSFGVIPQKQFYHCFGCKASGNAISFIMNYLHLGFVEAIDILASRLGLSVPREGSETPKKSSKNLHQLLEQVNAGYQKNLREHGQVALDYLQRRGINQEIATLYQIGFAAEGWNQLEKSFPKNQAELIATGMLIQKEDSKTYDRYRKRIMFPIHNRSGQLIGFGGRALDADQTPKYLNSPETLLFQKSRVLYGLHQILSQKGSTDSLFVVEGYMDVIALAQYGICNVVATLGTAITPYHIQLLSKYSQQVFFCFDGDHAGKEAAWRALENSLPYVDTGLNIYFMFLPDAQDPDSFIREKGKERFLAEAKQAIPMHRFFFDRFTAKSNLSNPAGKTQLIHAIQPFLQKMPEGSYKQLLIEELSRLTHLENHRLSQMIKTPPDTPVTNAPKTAITRSPIQLAIALLLQNPEIYVQCEPHIDLKQLNEKEHAILIHLLGQLAANSKATTATLIEPWRNTKYFDTINQLAAWAHQVPQQALTKELIDILVFLQKQDRERKIQFYLEKSRHEGLTAAERIDLQMLLKEKQEINSTN